MTGKVQNVTTFPSLFLSLLKYDFSTRAGQKKRDGEGIFKNVEIELLKSCLMHGVE